MKLFWNKLMVCQDVTQAIQSRTKLLRHLSDLVDFWWIILVHISPYRPQKINVMTFLKPFRKTQHCICGGGERVKIDLGYFLNLQKVLIFVRMKSVSTGFVQDCSFSNMCSNCAKKFKFPLIFCGLNRK